MHAALRFTLFRSSHLQVGPQVWCSFSVAARPSSALSAWASSSSGVGSAESCEASSPCEVLVAGAVLLAPALVLVAAAATDFFLPWND